MEFTIEKDDKLYRISFDKFELLNVRNKIIENYLEVDEMYDEVPYVKLKEYSDFLKNRKNKLTYNFIADLIPGYYRPEEYIEGDEDRMCSLKYSECNISNSKLPNIVYIINNLIEGKFLDLNELMAGPSDAELILFTDDRISKEKLCSFYQEVLSLINIEKIKSLSL